MSVGKFRYYILVPCQNYHYPVRPVDSCDYITAQQVEGHTVYGWAVFERELSAELCEKHHLIPEKGGC